MSAQFWHDDNRLTARIVCGDAVSAHFCIAALDPDTLDTLATWAPENQTLYTPYATATNRTIVLPTLQGHIFEVERLDSAKGTTLRQIRDIDLSDALPIGHSPSSSYYDEDGNIWFSAVRLASTGSIEDSSFLGYVTPDGTIHTTRIDNQRIEISMAVNGKTIYINTGPLASNVANDTGNMMAFQTNANGDIKSTWVEKYSAGSASKPGGFARGSGSTPSLVGDKFVAMTDNADVQVNLVVYRQVEDYEKNVPKAGSSFVCKVPVFQPNASANENAMVGYFDGTTYSVVINNNFNAPEMQSLGDMADINGDFNNMAPLACRITRVDISEDGDCKVRWTLPVRSTSVLSLSTANGLVYSYTQDEELAADGEYVWYFTAIDFRTGELAWRVRAGAGGNYNNNVAPTQMSPNGGIYQVVLGGVTWLRDDVV
ncbi:hypothetical protein QQX98_009583 [Neonectria punicea]|uniref:Uncharacterized protein n=1 Tax=Neonectria punicea TaxID=979145 RepID=A0ABR1GRY0_9HYPO